MRPGRVKLDPSMVRLLALVCAIVGAAAYGGRVALASMGGTPLRATATEEALKSGAPVEEAAQLAAEGTSPASW